MPGEENEKQLLVAGAPPVGIQNFEPKASHVQSTEQLKPLGVSITCPVPEKLVLAGAAVDPPNSAAIDFSRPHTSPLHGWPDFKKTAKGALWSILKIAKEAAVPLPPLQAILGGLVASAEIYNVSMRQPVHRESMA